MQEPDQPDAKTLIRHAMQALEDQFGSERAAHLVRELRDIHNDIRRMEGPNGAGLTPVRSIAANMWVDHSRLAVVPKRVVELPGSGRNRGGSDAA